jgi:hypothetical protein
MPWPFSGDKKESELEERMRRTAHETAIDLKAVGNTEQAWRNGIDTTFQEERRKVVESRDRASQQRSPGS